MATGNLVLTDHAASLVEQCESGDADRFAVLRKAAQEGIADIDAGRFKTFESKQGLREHLQGIAASALKPYKRSLWALSVEPSKD
ncbi:hypothetical protein [Limnohabitans sp. G3-2]|uniref:hypothetical protein n=1 Tax=Limnohabitans sp. G3-2 TaxID=1100711 RepID=UPI0018ECC1D4|nr:hypothetical protein [Limnohabitans sp. G3-2]